MAVSIATLTAPTGVVGSTVTVAHSLGDLPQIVLATMMGRTEAVDTVGEMSYQKSFGVAIQPPLQAITQYGVGASSRDGTATSSARVGYRKSGLVVAIDPAGVVGTGILALQSTTTTTATFVVVQQFSAAVQIHLQLFGGPDLTWVNLNNYAAPTAAGTQVITSPGFQPDLLLFFGPHSGSTPGNNETENDSSTFLGVCDKNLNQWVWAGGCDDADNSANGQVHSYMRAGKSLACISATGNGFATQGAVQSLDPLGFTLNWDTINLDAGQVLGKQFVALAVKGGQWTVGNYLSQLDTATHQVVSTLTQQPDGLVLVSANKVASTNLTLDNTEQLSVGFVAGTTNELQYAGQKPPTWTNTVVFNAVDYDDSYLNVSTAVATVGRAKVVSLQSNGFTIQHAVADPTQNFIGYLAYAHTIPPGVLTTVTKTVKPLGGGDYLTLQAAFQGELAAHKNLVMENIILEFDVYRGLDSTPAILPGNKNTGGLGYITSATNYPYINVIEPHLGVPDYGGTTYYRDVNGNGGISGIKIQCEFARFKGLQTRYTVSDGVTTGQRAAYQMASTGMTAPTFWQFVNCIADLQLTNASVAHGFNPPSTPFDGPGVSWLHVNCIVFNALSQDSIVSGFNTTKNSNPADVTIRGRYYNCTAYNCFQGWQDELFVQMLNCVAIGCDKGFNTTKGPNAASNYNFSTAGPVTVAGVALTGTTLQGTASSIDARGVNSRNGFPVLVLNADALDLRPDFYDTGITGHGVDLSADAFFPFNFDVAGNTRSGTWTQGAFHNVQSALQHLRWFWVGNVTDTTATLKVALTQAAAGLTLFVSTQPNLSNPLSFVSGASDANNVITFLLTGLVPNTQYYYQLTSGGLPILQQGAFSTYPILNSVASFTFACGGCQDTGTNSNIYDAIRSYAPQFMVHYGDLHYYNVKIADITLFRQALEVTLTQPKTRRLWHAMANEFVWDDHDYGGDNVDGTSPSKATAQTWFLETPHRTLPAGDGSVYHSYLVGRCRFIMTDLRSNKDPDSNPDGPSHTMMGATQLAWFKSELLAAKAAKQFIFWFSTVPWNSVVGENHNDDWAGFRTEQKNISDFIQANSLGGQLIIFTGDQHAAAIDDGTHDRYNTDGSGNNVIDFNPFPLNQSNTVYLATWTQGPITHVRNHLMGYAGIVHVVDDGVNFTITLNVINELGVQLTYTKGYFLPAPGVNPSNKSGSGNLGSDMSLSSVQEILDRNIERYRLPGSRNG